MIDIIMKNKKLYYFLQWTWGLPMNLIGYLASLCVMSANPDIRPLKWGGCYYFVLGKKWGGVSLGSFVFVCKEYDEHMLNHEFGHTIQNCYYGFLFPFVVAIPSFVRCWYYNIVTGLKLKGYDELPNYYSIWFEAEANELGAKYIKYWCD